jgi:tRNA threonylcarbamoyladenosine biosynthesis protein TsaB
MNFLVIDTSGEALYIGAYYNGVSYSYYEEDLKYKHSEILLTALDRLLKENSISLESIDFFCSAVGPGSFTGIRIGVTTVRAFAQVYNKPVLAVNSLEIKAYNIGINGAVIPLIEAAGENYYCAAYLKGVEIVKPFICPASEIENFKNSIKEKYNSDAYFVCEKEIEGVKDIIKPVTPYNYTGYCADKINKGQYSDYNCLIPLYAALSQAEKEYEKRQK